jgi:hypothetical protein
MSDLTVVARHGLWMLVDEDDAELGSFPSQAEALQAIGDYTLVDFEPRYVLIQDPTGDGDWAEEIIEPPLLH